MHYSCFNEAASAPCNQLDAVASNYPTPAPLSTVPPDGVAPLNDASSLELQMLLAVVLYLGFFGWVGVKLGSIRAFIIFIVALVTWIGLQIRGSIVLTLTNLAGKLVQAILSGEFGDADLAAIAEKPDIITEANADVYLFFVWAVIVGLTYVFTAPRRGRGRSERQGGRRQENIGTAILGGIAIGLLCAAILLPRLVGLVLPEKAVHGYAAGKAGDVNLLSVLDRTFTIIVRGMGEVWRIIQPYASVVFFIVLVLFLVAAAASLRPPRRTGQSGSGSGSAAGGGSSSQTSSSSSSARTGS